MISQLFIIKVGLLERRDFVQNLFRSGITDCGEIHKRTAIPRSTVFGYWENYDRMRIFRGNLGVESRYNASFFL